MATINRNLQLRDIEGNLVFPRASADNIQISKNDGRDAVLVVTVNGKIDPALLPSSVTSVDMLLSLSAAAPTGATTGDRYYNVTQNKIYTYTGSAWADAETPDAGKIYLDKRTNNLYRYDSTSSQMMDILVHFDVTQDVANDPTDASSTNVPSEHAVSVALTKKQDNLTAVAPISIDGASSISFRYGSGLVVDGNSLVVPQNYITGTVDDLMMRDATAASPETAIVDGGTVYSILGNYEVTNTISTTVVEDTRVPTEKAVRDAINAYVATGGSSVTAGKAINVDGGSINVTAATVGQVLGATVTGSTTTSGVVSGGTVGYITQDDLSAVTPGNLRSAMSLAQAVDVSVGPWNSRTGTQIEDYLSGFTVAAVNGTTVGFYDNGTHKFPKFAPTLVYLFVCDVTGSGSITPNGGSAITLSSTPKRITMSVTANNTGYLSFTGNATCVFSNWRQYEVTSCTPDARTYIGTLSNPDKFFRDVDAHSIKNKYLIKQDMVSPFIPTIKMDDDSDLTIGAGLAYKLQITGGTHYISVDTIPENGYGWDAHLQIFVKDTSSVVFKSPLNLLDPLTPNAGQNLTIKFRNGQANVYVDDIDVGYVVTALSGSTYGTLSYGLANDVGEYIVFSNALDGSVVNVDGGIVSRTVNIVGNGSDKTTLTGDAPLLFNQAANYTGITFTNIKLDPNLQGGKYIFSDCKWTDYNTTITPIVGHGFKSFINCSISGNSCGEYSSSSLCYCRRGGEFVNCVFTDNYKTLISTQYSGYTLTITDCYFNNPNATIAVSVQNQNCIITGSTFASSNDAITLVNADSTATFSGVNILNSTVSGAGQTVLSATSILDLSNNSTYQVVSGGTVSAVEGAKVIPYGGSTAITVTPGSGNTLTNTGKLGFLVTESSGTGNNSLYDALVGNGVNYSTVIFDPSVAGGTFSLPASGFTFSQRPFIIDGNGVDSTTITGSMRSTNASNNTRGLIKNVTFRNFYSNQVWMDLDSCTFTELTGSIAYVFMQGYIKNCLITGNTYSSSDSVMFWPSNGDRHSPSIVQDCVFTNNKWGTLLLCCYNRKDPVINCVFTNNETDNALIRVNAKDTLSGTVSECYFNNPSLDPERAIKVTYDSTIGPTSNLLITGSTFASPADGIYIGDAYSKVTFADTNVINSTVSGIGTVEFADITENDVTTHSTLTGTAENHCIITGFTETTTEGGITTTTVTPIKIQAREISANATGTGRWVELNYVEITGATAPNNGFSCGKFTNCTFKDIHASGSNNTFFSTQYKPSGTEGFEFSNCTFDNVRGVLHASVYATSGTVKFNNCTVQSTSDDDKCLYHHGIVELSGTNQIYAVRPVSSSSDGAVRIISGSTINLYSSIEAGSRVIEIGTYSGTTWNVGGTIIVTKYDGTGAVTITGRTGTYIKIQNGAVTHNIVSVS